jgi:hypothetical protein
MIYILEAGKMIINVLSNSANLFITSLLLLNGGLDTIISPKSFSKKINWFMYYIKT